MSQVEERKLLFQVSLDQKKLSDFYVGSLETIKKFKKSIFQQYKSQIIADMVIFSSKYQILNETNLEKIISLETDTHALKLKIHSNFFLELEECVIEPQKLSNSEVKIFSFDDYVKKKENNYLIEKNKDQKCENQQILKKIMIQVEEKNNFIANLKQQLQQLIKKNISLEKTSKNIFNFNLQKYKKELEDNQKMFIRNKTQIQSQMKLLTTSLTSLEVKLQFSSNEVKQAIKYFRSQYQSSKQAEFLPQFQALIINLQLAIMESDKESKEVISKLNKYIKKLTFNLSQIEIESKIIALNKLKE